MAGLARRLTPAFRTALYGALLSSPVIGCGASLPPIPTGPHPLQGGTTPIVVDEAPPPAELVELTSTKPPSPDCRWSDGFWAWEDSRWLWQAGGWLKPEPGCYFAEPLLVWAPGVNNGVLFHTPGQWYRDGGQGLCPAPPRCELAGP